MATGYSAVLLHLQLLERLIGAGNFGVSSCFGIAVLITSGKICLSVKYSLQKSTAA